MSVRSSRCARVSSHGVSLRMRGRGATQRTCPGGPIGCPGHVCAARLLWLWCCVIGAVGGAHDGT
eukprot:6340214-Prymnesium_polylepis.1